MGIVMGKLENAFYAFVILERGTYSRLVGLEAAYLRPELWL